MTDLIPPEPPPPFAPGPPPAPASWDATVQGWQPPAPSAAPSDGIPLGVMIGSLLPIGLVLLLAVIAPGFLGPLLDDAMPVLGMPPIVVFLGALAALFAINVLAARAFRNPFVLGRVVAMTTTAGVFIVILAPAVILILVNLQDLPVD